MKIEEIIKTSVDLPLSKKVIINLIYTEKWIQEQISSVLKPFDISIQQFNVLRILKGQKGKPANLSTIQNRMVSKMSNTTRLVDKLIQKEFVNRQVCPTNRRKVEITITQQGLDFLDTVSPVMNDFENELTSALTSKELSQLNTLLNKLRSEK
ncbi:MarR family winged helix-turn-helix transcriptional regulator [Aquimarina brevivitae]|uniref:DNA-binding MarR family transcriptional regulator n=1 Tax=Aquimarina brevivitae TaxID=323412 RepID=A0A4Q7PIT5_9FLAO|nr:MarR family transcriptional regulator [Aquimarina brevivitae]RZT00178.1 DNA-binding MarR family transcriptional regulator [Aquimarina brevivitae]